MKGIVLYQDVWENWQFDYDIILTQFAYSTTLPLSHGDAKEDPNGTKLCKAGYLQEQGSQKLSNTHCWCN